MTKNLTVQSPFKPAGNQPDAIDSLVKGLNDGLLNQVLLGVTGSGKTFTMAKIIESTQRDSRFKYLSSKDGDQDLKFKKKALDIGIQKSIYDYLLFTDVDCSISPSWVSTMANYFSMGAEYLVGHSFTNKTNIFNIVSSFQRMDLFILMVM